MDPIIIIIIVISALMSLGLVTVSILAFQDGSPAIGAWFLIGSISAIVMAVMLSHNQGHKSGQIDAANGKQKYHLTTQPDNTSKWELKEIIPD